MRRVLAWIVLPLVLVPCSAMETTNQAEEMCPKSICIVLAIPETLKSSTGGILVSEGGGGWTTDTITATVTTPILGSPNMKGFRVMVLHGSVQVDRPPESYLLVLRPFEFEFKDHFGDFEALEAYPMKDGKVCTFRSLKDYALGGIHGDNVIRPLSERKNCYSVDDLKRLAW
jgi:hypothetical protein